MDRILFFSLLRLAVRELRGNFNIVSLVWWVAAACSLFAYGSAEAGAPADATSLPPAAEFRRAVAGPPGERSLGPQSRSLDSGPVQKLKARVAHIEVTQGVQNPSQDVPILAGRTTFIRVFFDIDGPGRNSKTAVASGRARVTLPDGSSVDLSNDFENFSPPPEIKGEQNGDLDAQRGDAMSGLVFRLPAERLVEGKYTVRMTDLKASDPSQKLSCANCASYKMSFEVKEQAPTLYLTVIGVSFKYKGQTYEPRDIDFDSVRSWLMRAYPLKKLVFDSRTISYSDSDTHPTIGESKQSDEFDCQDVNRELAQIRAADVDAGLDARTHFLGLVFDGSKQNGPFPWLRGCAAAIPGTPDTSAVAASPAGDRYFNWDESGSYAGWYGGHELAHTLGRRHVGGACNELGTDSSYPYPNGDLSDGLDRYAVFDPGDTLQGKILGPLALLGQPNNSGRNAHDIMSYCDWLWSSAYTYKFLLERLSDEDRSLAASDIVAGAASAGPTRSLDATARTVADAGTEAVAISDKDQSGFLHVIAQIDEGWRTAKIASVSPSRGPASIHDENGSVPKIEIIGPDQQVFASYPVGVFEFTEESKSREPHPAKPAGIINVTIPAGAAAKGVRISYAGVTLVEQFSEETPLLSLRLLQAEDRSLSRSLEPGSQSIVLTWEAEKNAGMALTYTVQLSADHGKSWQTVAVNLKESKLEITPRQLSPKGRQAFAGGEQILYKVIAHNGFKTTEITGVVQ